jgi:hypothetical protein
MFCVTNAAIRGTFPHPLTSTDPGEQAANQAYAAAWSRRLSLARTDCLSLQEEDSPVEEDGRPAAKAAVAERQSQDVT